MHDTIGGRLAAERVRLGRDVAAFAAKAGITARSQRNYEKGSRIPDAAYLAAVAELGVDVGFVVSGVPGPAKASADDESLLRECEILEAVLSGVDQVLDGGAVPMDSAKRQACVVFLYRAVRRGMPLDRQAIVKTVDLARNLTDGVRLSKR